MSTATETAPRESTASAASIPLTELDVIQDQVDHQHCLVCYSTLDHPAITPCDHNEICGVCTLRLRHLHGDKKCPICKQENDKLIVDVPGKSFDEYPMWGDDLGSNFVYREKVGMFFPKDYYATVVEPLFGFSCTEPNCPYDGKTPDDNIYEQMQQQGEDGENNNNNKKKTNNKSKKAQTPLRALQDHLRVKHKLALCNLCVEHKRDFVARLPRLPPSQLKSHMAQGDGPGSGFDGHPVCEFCRPKRFYDLQELHVHLRKDHYKCHICERQGIDNQFFRNYQNLEKHFDKQHFLCHDVQCLAARFVCFENEIDLHAHERQIHGGTSSGSSKIQLEFRTRRTGYDGSGVAQRQDVPSEDDFNYGLNGEAFVPAALPTTNDLTLHPLHMQRTAEFRAQAAQMRQQQEAQLRRDSFPSLQAAAAGSDTDAAAGQQLTFGWTSGGTLQRVAAQKKQAGKVTAEDFPSLPSAPPTGVANAKLRGAVSGNRQFAAMRSAAMAPAPAGGSWSASRAPGIAAAPSSTGPTTASFPSLAAPASHANRQADLTPDNFPSLGPGSKKANSRYSVSNMLGKKNQPQRQQQVPSWQSTSDFPAPSAVATAPRPMAPVQMAPPPQKAPSLDSTMDFPAPPSASAQNNSVKNKVLGNQKIAPSKAAMSNMLHVPQSAVAANTNPKDTLRDMQASLGPAKYKNLKKFTREFAEGEMEPDAFIDHAAALFDTGYGDPDFWRTIPALVSSCPNQTTAAEALRYMESVRARTPAPAPAPVAAPPVPIGNWGSAPADMKAAPPAAATPGWPGPAVTGRGAAAAARPVVGRSIRSTSTGTHYVLPGSKKNAWGGTGGSTTVITAKMSRTSVVGAAAKEGPQGGTATKFMAKDAKQQHQAKQNAGKGKKKKKQNEELKNLAFGR